MEILMHNVHAKWASLTDNYDSFQLTVIGTFLIGNAVYWAHGLLYLILDLTNKPEFLYQFKIQKKAHLDMVSLKRLLKNLILNFFIVLPILSIGIYNAARSFGYGVVVTSDLPDLKTSILHFIGYVLIYETFFYFSHRLLHFGSLYRSIHKVHHEFRSPVALAAAYAHPIEFIVGDIIPLMLPPILLRSHLLLFWIWTIFGNISTQIHHSGYRFPWTYEHVTEQPDFHDFHHENFVGNYGVLGFYDWLFGTNASWIQRKQLLKKAQAAKTQQPCELDS
jgi:sterol desaturase/sphingolipid hydroxylase (fatty acid hydroxylase superfamily)